MLKVSQLLSQKIYYILIMPIKGKQIIDSTITQVKLNLDAPTLPNEAATKEYVDIPAIVRETIKDIGYTKAEYGIEH